MNTTRFPGCLRFQSRALCPQSISSGLWGGGGRWCWFLLQSLQLQEPYSKTPNTGGTPCSSQTKDR